MAFTTTHSMKKQVCHGLLVQNAGVRWQDRFILTLVVAVFPFIDICSFPIDCGMASKDRVHPFCSQYVLQVPTAVVETTCRHPEDQHRWILLCFDKYGWMWVCSRDSDHNVCSADMGHLHDPLTPLKMKPLLISKRLPSPLQQELTLRRDAGEDTPFLLSPGDEGLANMLGIPSHVQTEEIGLPVVDPPGSSSPISTADVPEKI